MLDTTTKKRIDDCRDILVGKLPDPKAQIEQITIGLIYKFMDDMDKESIELGGSAKFFSGDYKKYSWDSLFDTKVTANEMLQLYSTAIESMEKNPNIPQLFRDIFNNAYLPYRDPETLKLFLKTIGEFKYTHSEKLGDAFEYLLSVMGSQGDAGQFRTPRHIIDFLVAIVDPGKTDTILDPACGTAGFLISAFKHILEKNKKGLTPDERQKLIKNFIGYDISPDMVRLSLVNLYLHGFSEPHIFEYDTLSSEDRWNDNFDVILANPPFMSPKGGIRPHKKFTISSNRSEVLFVDYIAEHLNPKGRAGIIVPEGVIFQSGKAYKELRKMLVDNNLYAVVSLPAGVFNPYSGVKTSILLMDKDFAKKTNEILFVKIDNDGYGLGAQRNAKKGGQLEEAIELLQQFKEGTFSESIMAHSVAKMEITKNGDYNLSGSRYHLIEDSNSNFDIVEVGEVVDILTDYTANGSFASLAKNVTYYEEEEYALLVRLTDLRTNLVGNRRKYVNQHSYDFLKKSSLHGGELLFANVGANIGTVYLMPSIQKKATLGPNMYLVKFNERINEKFAFYNFRSEQIRTQVFNKSASAAQPKINKSEFRSIKIPLPPLSIQEEIVSEIEGYQKIIDGAKAVVENYKPNMDIDPDWEMVELDSIAQVISGFGFSSSDFKEENLIKCIKITNVGVREFVDDDTSRLPESYLNEYSKYIVNTGDLVISLTRTIISSGLKITIVPESWNNTLVNQRVAGLKPTMKSNINFIYHYLCSDVVFKYVEEQSRSLMQPNLSITDLKKLQIPNPPIEIQNKLVAKIEIEQNLVNANRQLITIFEQKIKDRIAKVWGG